MGPKRPNPIQRTVRSVHMCVLTVTLYTITVADNKLTTQNRPDISLTVQTITIAPMMSI